MEMDVSALFRLSVDPLELVLRGSAMYWFLFLLFRFLLRRDVGALGIADVLLLVLVADASQNAMAGGYQSVADGCLLVLTIALWNYLFDWAGFHVVWLRRFIEPPQVQLVRRGRILVGNLRRQLMTIEELQSKLREQGIEQLSEVKLAAMEPDGAISVIRRAAPPRPPA